MRLARQMAFGSGAWTPLTLFAGGVNGVWYDPSDLTAGNMYQDSAKTTAVTAVEQPVGWIQDKSGNGNHASQSVSANRPTLSARVNLLQQTEALDNTTYWIADHTTVTGNTTNTIDPLGGNTAEKLLETSDTSLHELYANTPNRPGFVTGLSYSWAIYVKGNGRQFCGLWISGYKVIVFDLTNISVAYTATSGLGSPTGRITDAGNGWRQCVYSFTAVQTAPNFPGLGTSPNGTSYSSFAGDTTKGVYVWGADLRSASDGVDVPTYQRVNTSTDYDTSGFPVYLAFDGMNDNLMTAAMVNLSGTDQISQWVGQRRTLQQTEVVAEFTPNPGFNPGAFGVYNATVSNSPPGTGVEVWSLGTAAPNNNQIAIDNSLSAPRTGVIASTASISGDSVTLRVNTVAGLSATGDQGSGNYTNSTLYLASRGGSSLFFSGRLYGYILRGASSMAHEISKGETWMNSKTKAY